jgi:hypothetical protein
MEGRCGSHNAETSSPDGALRTAGFKPGEEATKAGLDGAPPRREGGSRHELPALPFETVRKTRQPGL